MKKLMTAIVILLSASSAWARECTNITKSEVMAAQKTWGEGIVAIGKAKNPKAVAEKYIHQLYAYDDNNVVLFKPTKAAEKQFRKTKQEALSYFVTGGVSEDKGFALAPYVKVRFENAGIITDCDSAIAMGNYYFTTTKGKEVKVEFSFAYYKDKDGKLKINLHHSSFPYKP